MAELGGAKVLYICPTCGCPDLMQKESMLALPAKERDAKCPNCNWAGKLSEAAGIATTEKVFDTKTVLNLLLYVVTKHAAGPIAQAFQFFGLIEKDDQVGLDKIMRAATEGLIEKAFMAAAEHAASKGNLANPPLERASSEQEWADAVGIGQPVRGIELVDGSEPPKMTEENVHLFHVITGEYDPGWQERERAAMPQRKVLMNVLWEHYLRDLILAKVPVGSEVTGIRAPRWVIDTLCAVQATQQPKLLGAPVTDHKQTEGIYVDVREPGPVNA